MNVTISGSNAERKRRKRRVRVHFMTRQKERTACMRRTSVAQRTFADIDCKQCLRALEKARKS